MKMNWKVYCILVLVFLLSSIGTFLLFPSNSELLQVIFAAPGVTALFGALFQLMRDEAEYEKRLQAQRRELHFALGTASHMANAAFDKHAKFCEKYLKELQEVVRTLYREGDTPDAIDHAAKLYTLRQDYSAWLTDRIDNDLDRFESALRELGANAHFIRAVAGQNRYSELRAIKVEENDHLYRKILGIKATGEVQEKSMVESLKSRVRVILGIEDLTRLREYFVEQASNSICH